VLVLVHVLTCVLGRRTRPFWQCKPTRLRPGLDRDRAVRRRARARARVRARAP